MKEEITTEVVDGVKKDMKNMKDLNVAKVGAEEVIKY
jgi:hypothetical protein